MGSAEYEKRKIAVAFARGTGNRQDVDDAARCAKTVSEVLFRAGFCVELVPLIKEIIRDKVVLSNVFQKDWAGVFNLFEGFDDDASAEVLFVEFLEGISVPFTGNSSATLRVCLDKFKIKQQLSCNGIAVPASFFIKDKADIEAVLRQKLLFPFFIKPCFEDASVGIDSRSLVLNSDALFEIASEKLEYFPSGILAEEFIPGDEYNVGLIGNMAEEVVGISLIDYSQYREFDPFLTYKSKWDTNSSEYKTIIPNVVTPKEIGESLWRRILELARKTCVKLNCKSYARVDLREKSGKLYVIDVNPNPDINIDSGFMRQAYAHNYTYGDIIQRIFSLANIE